jgi:uncharacterized protein (DUF433 family)
MGEIRYFTTEQAHRLTGLSLRRLGYWAKTGFFVPEDLVGAGPYRRLYSFRNIVGLRTIAALIALQVTLPELRRVASRLESHQGPWSDLTFAVGGRRVFWREPQSDIWEGAHPPGQTVIPVAMAEIERDALQAVQRLSARREDQIGKVSRNRNVAQNAWVISGTRVPTGAVYALADAGYDTRHIIREYPRLSRRDVESAIKFETSRRRDKAS